MAIGFIDLVSTAVLHANGQIVEMNPIMRPLIEHSEWLFIVVKAMTLILAWAVMVWYAKKNLDFVRKTCLLGTGVYLVVWAMWFLASA